MKLPDDDAAVLAARWNEGVLLKRDVFSTVERGRYRGDAGEVDAVLRRLDEVPWWSFIPARHLFARERKALALAKGLNVGPELLWAGKRALVRGFIDGVALHLAKPNGDVAYFRSAKVALHRLHRHRRFFDKRVARIEDCVVETGVKGLGLVSGEGDPLWAANPRPATKNRLIASLA